MTKRSWRCRLLGAKLDTKGMKLITGSIPYCKRCRRRHRIVRATSPSDR